MGANIFFATGEGASAKAAFKAARDQALYDHGHSGYTGSLAEKNDFVTITPPAGADPHKHARELIDKGDGRIDDKWGPAGCIKISENKYLFFGWASS